MSDKKNVLHELAHAAIDLRKLALLEDEPNIAPSKETSDSEISIEKYKPEFVTMQTSATKPGLLILADAYAFGWKAWMDGTETKILRANYLFRSVVIPDGVHRVAFRYEAPGLRTGGTISAVAWLALIVWAFWMWYRDRRTSNDRASN